MAASVGDYRSSDQDEFPWATPLATPPSSMPDPEVNHLADLWTDSESLTSLATTALPDSAFIADLILNANAASSVAGEAADHAWNMAAKANIAAESQREAAHAADDAAGSAYCASRKTENIARELGRVYRSMASSSGIDLVYNAPGPKPAPAPPPKGYPPGLAPAVPGPPTKAPAPDAKPKTFPPGPPPTAPYKHPPPTTLLQPPVQPPYKNPPPGAAPPPSGPPPTPAPSPPTKAPPSTPQTGRPISGNPMDMFRIQPRPKTQPPQAITQVNRWKSAGPRPCTFMHFIPKQPAPQPGASSSSGPLSILCSHGRHRSPQVRMMLLAVHSMVDESDSEEDEADPDREAQEVEEVQEAQESIQEVEEEEEEESELLRENIHADEEAQDSSSSEEERYW